MRCVSDPSHTSRSSALNFAFAEDRSSCDVRVPDRATFSTFNPKKTLPVAPLCCTSFSRPATSRALAPARAGETGRSSFGVRRFTESVVEVRRDRGPLIPLGAARDIRRLGASARAAQGIRDPAPTPCCLSLPRDTCVSSAAPHAYNLKADVSQIYPYALCTIIRSDLHKLAGVSTRRTD